MVRVIVLRRNEEHVLAIAGAQPRRDFGIERGEDGARPCCEIDQMEVGDLAMTHEHRGVDRRSVSVVSSTRKVHRESARIPRMTANASAASRWLPVMTGLSSIRMSDDSVIEQVAHALRSARNRWALR